MRNKAFCCLAKAKGDPRNMILGVGGGCQTVRVQTTKEKEKQSEMIVQQARSGEEGNANRTTEETATSASSASRRTIRP
jgi:hypothetical protein